MDQYMRIASFALQGGAFSHWKAPLPNSGWVFFSNVPFGIP